MTEEPRAAAGAEDAPPESADAPGRWDRLLVAAFGVYAVLVLIAAWAQLTDNRAVLRILDLNTWFQR